jgi:hypothetical protein
MSDHYSSFNSLLEVFTAFNFAFIVSDTFNTELRSKIIGSFRSIENSLVAHDSTVKSGFKELKDIAPELPGESNEKKIETALRKLHDLETTLTEVTSEVNSKIEEHSVVEGFSELCLFTGLFSLLLLFLVGINNATNGQIVMFNEAFFVLNVLSVSFVICHMTRRKFFFINMLAGNRYRHSLMCFILIVILGVFTFVVLLFSSKPHCHAYELEAINVCLMILSPTVHFLYHFYIGIRNSTVVAGSLRSIIDERFAKPYAAYSKDYLEPIIKFGAISER